MFNRLKKINKNQKGFTLIELIMVIAITALIIGVIAMSISLVFNVSARSDSHMLAVRQVQNAGHWINLDTQMAQTVQLDESEDTGFPLTLTWTEGKVVDGHLIEGDEHRVRYTLEDDKLQREHYTNYDPDDPDDPDSTIFVAEYIDQAETSCSLTGGGTFTLPYEDDAFTITGGAVADSGKITVDTGDIKVTTDGGATYNAGTDTWTTPDANGTVVVKASEDITAGVWTSTTANAKVAIIAGENAIITGRVLTLMVTATVSGWHEVTETRVYEIVRRPD